MGIIVKNLTKRFIATSGKREDFLAVDDVSFTVPQGHLVALLGPSGSGKSTVLRIISGLEQPDSGQLFLEGREMTSRPPRERGVGFVFQHYALFKHMTVWNNIAFGLKVNKWSHRDIVDRVTELLNLVQLTGYRDRYTSQLSGGQRQRVALARALAHKPQFLLLDEPFGALDAKVRRNLSRQLRQLHDEVKTTSVFVTHDQEEAMELADEIVVINHGRVEQIGTSEQIYNNPNSKFVASFIGNVNVIEGISDGRTVRIGEQKVIVPGVTPPEKSGELVLLIRPENIEWCRESSSHTLNATIVSTSYRGDRYEVMLDLSGIEIHMMVDKTRGQSRDWAQGARIPVKFPKYSIFQAEEGHAVLRARLQSLGYLE